MVVSLQNSNFFLFFWDWYLTLKILVNLISEVQQCFCEKLHNYVFFFVEGINHPKLVLFSWLTSGTCNFLLTFLNLSILCKLLHIHWKSENFVPFLACSRNMQYFFVIKMCKFKANSQNWSFFMTISKECGFVFCKWLCKLTIISINWQSLCLFQDMFTGSSWE